MILRIAQWLQSVLRTQVRFSALAQSSLALHVCHEAVSTHINTANNYKKINNITNNLYIYGLFIYYKQEQSETAYIRQAYTGWANKNRTLCYQLLIKIQANTQCWIICHFKCKLFSRRMTYILSWNVKWLFVRFTSCHSTTVTLNT